MTFSADAVAIVRLLYAGVNPQDDDARRLAIQRVGEQLAFSLGPRWGNKKRAGLSDAFRSPDSIAYLEDDGTISVWDIQASSGAILVHEGKAPDHPRLPASEAAFMPCRPVNHLGVPEAEPPPPLPPAPADLAARLQAIEAELTLLRVSVAKLHEKPAPAITFPDYEGGPWYARTTLKPVKPKP